MDSFAFNGSTITAKQLRKQVTAYSEGALQTALENGCKDVPSVMAFLARRDSRAIARRVVGGRTAARVPSSRVKVVRK